MKKTFSIFFLSLFFIIKLDAHELKVKVDSGSAILMEADSKHILFQKEAFKERYPASIIKLPAALYAIKKNQRNLNSMAVADMDCIGSISQQKSEKMKYRYPAHWIVVGATHLSIHKEERLSVKDLLYGILLVSAADASNIVAKHTSGSISQFIKELNVYTTDLGCKNTCFKNPHGLYYPKQSTTAFDMALIGCEVFSEPDLIKILKTTHYKLSATNKQSSRWIKNFDKLIHPKSKFYYPYAIGGKTGFQSNAKCTFIALAEKKEHRLVVVLLDCPSGHKRFEDAIKLFKAGFKELEKKKVQ